jgi:type I restriction enzyme S subunit
MSFPRYPAYKPSGVEWLGEVPEHWEVLPCRGIVDERNEKNEGAACQDYLSLMANVGIIPYEEKGDVGNKKPEDLGKCKLVRKGDFVINSMNYGIGSYGVSGYDGVCSPVYIVLIPNEEEVRPGFAFRIFEDKTFQSYAQSFGNGILAHRCAIGWNILRGIGVPVPSSHEQERILQFLDHETAKIDALIAEQQRLIELLQEKRQAVISQAVTKGLNPDAPVKDSGVEWLGEVPEHWSLARLKHAAKEKVAGPYGASLTKSMYTDAGYRVYGQQQVIADNFEEGDYYIDGDKYEEMKRYSVSPGDVLISVMGTVGKVAVVPDFVEPGIINPRLVRYHLRDLLIPRFAQKLLLSTPFQEKILLEAKGATMDGLNMQILGDLPLPVPPRVEQEAILDQLHRSLASFDAMSSSVEESILLLKERRSALISAAVTGQIDVRGLVTEACAA